LRAVSEGHTKRDMSHIEERELERFITGPESIDAKRRSAIRDHLEECDACKSLAAFLGDFDYAMHQAGGVSSADMECILRRIVPAPERLPLEASAHPSFVQASGLKGDRFVPIGMLSSESGMGSLILHRNRTSSNFRAEFRTDRFPVPPWGVFSFGESVHVVLNADGFAEFSSSSQEPELLESALMEGGIIRFPVGSVRVLLSSIPVGQSRTFAERAGRFSAKFRRQEEQVRVEVTALSGGGGFGVVSVIDEAGSASVHPLHESVCVIPEERLPGEIRVNVYR